MTEVTTKKRMRIVAFDRDRNPVAASPWMTPEEFYGTSEANAQRWRWTDKLEAHPDKAYLMTEWGSAIRRTKATDRERAKGHTHPPGKTRCPVCGV